ncbi:VCBS domain-containing protein [Bradyrhizobium sp. WSM 1704]|uniref:Ig-like domain-containing protein n=1 Tax=Bradyrhizobium semiaridum TaxID=2821404 RepID=UPI001CE2691C|nr:Ig-like domain-containing protein [Bradyrhizobium semiaridum]MCA6122729.1 VCBS domain-containing protein [Bradyrhizobium semiaridum]
MTDSSIQLDSGGSILFVGNSFTFGRVDPVMSYNSDNVRDLTAPVPGTTFANTTGSNPYEPHPWGGVPGIFEAFAEQSGLQLDVAISARNAATLQGQYLNSNPAGWDLRGNVASQAWDTVVLQDNSTQALPSGSGSITFAAGSSTATLVIHPTADTTKETDETIGLQITADPSYRTSAGVVTGTILNDDPGGPVINPALPTVTLVASPGAVLEDGTQKLVYTSTRTGPTDTPLTIQFGAARDGSTAPSVNTSTGDFENFVNLFTTSFEANGQQTTGSMSFTSNSGSVVIPAGASSATLTLDPKADTTVENDESIRLTLSASATYNVGTQGTISATILNDDFAPGTDTSLPNISLSLAASAVYEDSSGNLVYQFTRSGPNTAPLTVNFSVSGTATLPGHDFTVTGANSFSTAGAANPDLQDFKTYAVKLAQYATTGAADGAVPANPHANAATEVYLYETWARPNMVTGAVVANTNDETGAVTNTATTAPEYYQSLEAMTADLRAAYEGLAAANPIFAGVAPVGAAFLAAVQNGTAIRNPYAPDAGTNGKVDLWWDDNLHASKYGSYLSALTLFGTLTGLDPRSLGAAEHAASDLGITPEVAAALQGVAAATLGFSLNAHWTAPGQVTELQGGVTGLLATAGSFGFSDSDIADTHTVTVTPLTPGSVGTFTAALHTDTTGDGTGGSVNWQYTVDNAAVAFLATGETRVEHFLVTLSDANGGLAQRDIAVTLNGSYNDAPVASNDTADAQAAGLSVAAPGVLGNDTDPEGDALVVSAVNGLAANVGIATAGTYGHLSLFSDGHYGYAADNSAALASAPTGSHLHDSFNYTVSDGNSTDTAALDITINRAPVANAEIAGVSRAGLVSGNVLANDSDPDGDAIAVAALNGGTLGQQVHGKYGWLTLSADGHYTYQSNGHLAALGVAQDRFTYQVTDAQGGISTASLTVTTAAPGQTYIAGTPGQTVSAGNGQTIVDGSLGHQTLSGGNGQDVLLGGPNDVLSGGSGPDHFVFQSDFGHNEIKDFGKPDVIELQASTFGSVANILAHYAVNDGHGNVVISDPHNADNTITVDHVNLSQLSANSFLLI